MNYNMKGEILTMRVGICDDDYSCLSATEEMVKMWSEETCIPIDLQCFNSGDALIAQSKTMKFDIVFLDIIMPMLNGMDTATELRQSDKTVKIIFLTSSPEFALQSYSVKATDYCLKPVTHEKLKAIMDECALFHHQEPAHLILKTLGGYQKVFLHNIEYIEAQNKRLCVFLSSGKTLEVLEPLYTLEKQLCHSKGFFKCHRSYLVYIPNVDYFSSTEIITKSGQRIPIARSYSKDFSNAYFSIMFQH